MSATISSILYALSDARISISGHESRPRETLIRIMEISQTGGQEDRIAALEKRLQEMDALVHGLLSELLDMKAVATTMTRQHEEHNRRELARGPVVLGTTSPSPSGSSASSAGTISSTGNTVIRPGRGHQPDVPAAPEEPQMVRIMQTDGTMKMEPRFGGNRIDSSAGYGRNKKGSAAQTKQNPLIYAADEEKSASSKK